MTRMLLILFLASASAAVQAEEGVVYIKNGFLKGEEYLSASEVRQRAYVMGLVDGIFISPLFDAPKARIVPFERCLEGMSDRQAAAILTKYLQNRPARWHEPTDAVFFGALKEACGIK